MTVYLINRVDRYNPYDDGEYVVAVYTTYEKAEKAANALDSLNRVWIHQIVPIDVDRTDFDAI